MASEEIDPGYYLMVYSRVPSSSRRRSLFGVVMLWAIDFLPLWKKVSGVQILLASRLLRGRRCIGPLNRSLSSFQLCRKKTSMVYSWHKETVEVLRDLNRSDGSKNDFSKIQWTWQPPAQTYHFCVWHRTKTGNIDVCFHLSYSLCNKYRLWISNCFKMQIHACDAFLYEQFMNHWKIPKSLKLRCFEEQFHPWSNTAVDPWGLRLSSYN